jgi:hypothetical protein
MRFFWIPAICLMLGGCASNPELLSTAGISEDFLFNWDRIEHATADVDGDGIDEWFLGNPATRGNAGLTWLVLQRRGETWWPMGELFLNPSAVRFLPPADDGSVRLVRYYRYSGSEGSVDTMTYRDGAFVVVASEVIHPGDSGTEEGRRRYEEVFSPTDGPNHRLQLTGDARE